MEKTASKAHAFNKRYYLTIRKIQQIEEELKLETSAILKIRIKARLRVQKVERDSILRRRDKIKKESRMEALRAEKNKEERKQTIEEIYPINRN